ncbi:MAG: DNA polymerase IV [Kiritimatiellae bacterium]|nr:DNA polymerase IV [Kiritimatiellia bacterium]
MERCILHIDMDAFFAAVEQRDHPEWRGLPVVVGAPPDRRGVVSTCSYEARKFGVRSAMPSREAYRRCPGAIFARPHMARYEAVSRQVFAILTRFTPLVEPISIDEAFMDVTGARRLFGNGREIADMLRSAIRQELTLTASVGVAHNKFLAKLASEQAKPDGVFVVPSERGSLLDFLGSLEVGALWGVGQVTGETLRRAGFRSVADIRRCDPAALDRLLGVSLSARLRALSLGQDERPVETGFEEKSVSKEHTFAEDCSEYATVRDTLKDLVDEVGRRLRERGHYATVGRVKLRWSDFKTITRQAPFPAPACDDFTFRELAMRLLAAERMVKPVRLIGFGVSGLCDARQQQPSLFDTAPEDGIERRERLCRAVDSINARIGHRAVKRVASAPKK